MKINGWDISQAGARQWNVTPGFHAVDNESEWVRGSPVPALFKNEIGFKRISIKLLIKREGGRQAILDGASEILARLIGPADLELDGFSHKFYGILAKQSYKEESIRRFHVLTLDFDCYEYAAEISKTFSGQQSILVDNPGNIITPAIIEITPQIGVASIEITGICRDQAGADLPVTVRELTTGNTVVLDGETGLITQAGELKAQDVDIWGLPALAAGSNEITINSTRMDITARYRPRFM